MQNFSITQESKKIWFKKKIWGFTPNTKEGWLVVLVYIVYMGYKAYSLKIISEPTVLEIFNSTLDMILSIIAFITITFLSGEKLPPLWGNKK